jgi:hypothetical protein
MNNKRLVILVVCDAILLDQVAQGYDVGYGIFAKPHIMFIAIHLCLVVDGHVSAVARKSHGFGRLDYVVDELRVTEQIHCGLAVQQDDILEIEIQFNLLAMALLE